MRLYLKTHPPTKPFVQWLIAGLLAMHQWLGRFVPVTMLLTQLGKCLVQWLLLMARSVYSNSGTNLLKSLCPSSIRQRIAFLLLSLFVGMMVIERVAYAEDTIDSNVTVQLYWKDYKRVTQAYSVTADGNTLGKCHHNVAQNFSVNIPFQQNVVLGQAFSGRCDAVNTQYHQGTTWIVFGNGHTLNYQGPLGLHIFSRNHRSGGLIPKCRSCTVAASVTFFGEATNRQREDGPYSFSIPVIRGKQELKRIPFPLSQFADGMVRDLECQANSDKPSEVALSCEVDGNEVVVYAELIEAIKLVAVSNPSPICAGESFDITLQTTPESKLVDGIEFSLKFDPTKLQANAVKNSGAFDDVLIEEINVGSIEFAAGVWDNNIPSGEFEIVTLNFTALAVVDGTDLQFDLENTNAAFAGKTLLVAADNETIVTQECMDCKVTLQGHPAIPPANSRWETELKIYVDGNQPYTIKTDGLGHCKLQEPSGNYSICVKGPHTLANRIGPPLMLGTKNLLDFGTLLEGDVNEDNKVDLLDRSDIYNSRDKCQGEVGYIENADLDENDCVKKADKKLFDANFKKPIGDENPAICEWDTSVTPPALRQGVREGGSVTIQTTQIPVGLTAGTSFDIAIQVNAIQPIDAAAAYLNFEPQKLRVNYLTAGDRFDDILENDFDNLSGHINFVAGAWENDLASGEFTLVTINFTLLEEGGEKTLSFSMTEPRNTEAVGGGKSVLAVGEQGGAVVFKDKSTVAPASCQVYAVHDEKRNDSQFFIVNLETSEVEELGILYKGYDIESLAIHPEKNMIYAASGDNVTNDKQGYLYLVDGQTGELFPIGSTGFKEIEDLAFDLDGTLWAWAKNDGIITIDLTTGIGTLILPSNVLVEGFTLSKEPNQTIFYGSVNTELWRYDMNANTLDVVCTNLFGETEALEMMPDGQLLVGTHNVPFGLHAFNPQICQAIIPDETLSNKFNDVEAIALPVDACAKFNSLIAYYPLDGNANDRSGHGNHGIEHGNLNYLAGKKGQAVNLDGIDDYIEILDSPNLHFGTRSFSIAMWLNANTFAGKSRANEGIRPLAKNGFPSTWWVTDILPNGQIQLAMKDDNAVKILDKKSTSVISTKQWYHLVIVVDRENSELRYYLNGTLDAIHTLPPFGDISVKEKPFEIGSGSFNPFNGLIDELYIFRRVLTNAEIQNLL